MKAHVKALWVTALRSGEYGQADGSLREVDTNNFCCLGVLCDVAVKAGVPVEVRVQDDRVTYDGEPDFLPESVREWAGLDDANPRVRYMASNGLGNPVEMVETLSSVNDDYENDGTFGCIPDLIEAQL